MSKQNIFETNQSTSRKTASMSMVSISSQEVVDYSFRDISSEKLAEFATKFVPRTGPKPVNDEKIQVKGVKLNNNNLSDLSALPEALKTVIKDLNEITWLDLSFNNISKIPSNFSESFPNLKMLYLHGNAVVDMKQLIILGSFPDLQSFTLHGNPIEAKSPDYKWCVIAYAPKLKSLNFTTLSKGDKQARERCKQIYLRNQKTSNEDED